MDLQHHHNNYTTPPLTWGGAQCVGPTPMWGGVVQLLYRWSVGIKTLLWVLLHVPTLLHNMCTTIVYESFLYEKWSLHSVVELGFWFTGGKIKQ
jgi:hypothetical protein